LHRVQQLLAIERLGERTVGAGGPGALEATIGALISFAAGNREYPQGRAGLLESLNNFDAIAAGHENIGHHEIAGVAPRELESLLARPRAYHLVAKWFQKFGDEVGNFDHVIRNDNDTPRPHADLLIYIRKVPKDFFEKKIT
jgi:hypothetical protein